MSGGDKLITIAIHTYEKAVIFLRCIHILHRGDGYGQMDSDVAMAAILAASDFDRRVLSVS